MHSELLTRLEAATGPDRELDAAIACVAKAGLPSGCDWAFKFPNWGVDGRSGRVRILGNVNGNGDYIAGHFTAPHYTASIDAALTLVPDGWRMAALCQRDPWFCRLETDDFESVTWGKGGDWITEVTSGSEATAKAHTPALSIVIAAIHAKGDA